MTENPLILVRACANLPGLRFGETASVDPDDPYIAELLGATLIVRVADESVDQEPEPEAPDDVDAPEETAGASVDGD